ncbi:MAG: UDP-N-acetylmuramoyl-L-alanyl-D-glutamate--2,6-diaminopimelate ligase [Synergistales bacterium]|nr:UDP-N-acetylmuramoyl-L-alanyl-D-glutamate--2,6-diaminopimelate ligase [Synergistales bacterium]
MVNLRTLMDYLSRKGFDPQQFGTDGNPLLFDVTHDSIKVKEGSLFCCVSGYKADGHDFAADANKRGAAALLCERPLDLPVPQLVVNHVRRAMGHAAAVVHDFPGEKLRLLAVTGTNGKSTSTYMIRHLLAKAGHQAGLIGTIIYSDGHSDVESDRTTPQNCDVQRLLAQMVNAGCDSCVMEASSHGLEQGRLEGCLFDGALFTNLTPEHLDYHGDMERYFAAKSLLFSNYMKQNWRGAVNVDDPFGRKLYSRWSDQIIPFGLSDRVKGGCGVKHLAMSLEGLAMDIVFPDGRCRGVSVPLTGRYNAYNALGVVSLWEALGLERRYPAESLKGMGQVPGRMERYCFSNGGCAVVDYAHSPDALEKVLSALKEVTSGRILAVFGLGGERYVENRPVMGTVAASLADYVLITSDNPRSEDPAEIAQQIAAGIMSSSRPVPYDIETDRKKAVFRALDMAQSGDVVFIGGKGPERFIVFSDRRIPYNDTEAVKEWAEMRGFGLSA